MGKFRKASFLTRLSADSVMAENHQYASWVCGFIIFKEDLGVDAFKALVKERILSIPRFRSRYDNKRNGFEELDVESEIDIDYHCKVVDEVLDLRKISDDYVGDVYKNFDFDEDKPLWQFVYFPRMGDGRSLLLTKISHAIGDGVSQVEILYRILDSEKTVDSAGDSNVGLRPPPKRSGVKGSFGPLNRFRIFTGGIFGTIYSTYSSSWKPLNTIPDIFSAPDSPNPMARKNPKNIGKKKTAFSEVISLDKIKEIKRKYEGATVNDVLTTLLTLTLIACFKEVEKRNGQSYSKGLKIRAGFAINSRKKGESAFKNGSPSNAAVQGVLRFRMDFKSRVDLLWDIKEELDAIKLSPAPFVQHALATTLMAILSKKNATKLFTNTLGNITALLSNVPGPQSMVRIAGREVDDIQFLLSTPRSSYLGILSYNGKVTCGVCLDETTDINPEDFTANWNTEFEKLYTETMSTDGVMKRPTKFWKKL